MLLREALLIVAVGVLILIIWAAFTRGAYPGDGLVGVLERKFQVVPGSTKVLPECNCTVRYLGTSIHGKRYMIVIERLD